MHYELQPAAGVTLNTLLMSATPSPGPNHIGPGAVALGACLIIINAVISALLSLGLEVQLLIAAFRCGPQYMCDGR